jgi:hypothetical protein
MTEKHKLTLDRPATYQIKVPGHLDVQWTEWVGGMTIGIGNDAGGLPFTALTCVVDQAALQGLLRRLYALGIPLISVICIDDNA